MPAFDAPRLAPHQGQLGQLERMWRSDGFAEKANHHPDCSPAAIAQVLNTPQVSLRHVQDTMRNYDVLLVGNSVTRNLYFTLKALLELASKVEPDLLEMNVVHALDGMVDLSRTYRAEENLNQTYRQQPYCCTTRPTEGEQVPSGSLRRTTAGECTVCSAPRSRYNFRLYLVPQ